MLSVAEVTLHRVRMIHCNAVESVCHILTWQEYPPKQQTSVGLQANSSLQSSRPRIDSRRGWHVLFLYTSRASEWAAS